jgi:uncharacterized DUF497 family protein
VRVDEFIWLPGIVEKIVVKHSVAPEEVEEIFFSGPLFHFQEKGKVQGENMYTAMAQTESGRYLIAFFIFKQGNRALIISARDMNASERKRYERKKQGH